MRSGSGFQNRWFGQVWFVPVGLVLLGLLVFGQGLALGFMSDDFDLMAAATAPTFGFLDPFPAGSGQYWRPLVLLSLRWLDQLIGGPAVQHLFNLVLHLANGCLVFALQRRDRHPLWCGLLALGFSLHVAQTTDVFWISGRTDLLASFFVLVSLLGLQHVANGKIRIGWGLAFAGLVAALLAKELAVILPLVALAYLPSWAKTTAARQRVMKPLLAMVIAVVGFVVLVRTTFYGEGLPGIQLGQLLGNGVRQVFFMVSPIPAPLAKDEPLWALFTLSPFLILAGWTVGLILRQHINQSSSGESTGMPNWLQTLGLVAAPCIATAPTLLFLDGSDARLMYLPLALSAVSLARLIPHPDRRFLVAFGLGVLLMASASFHQGQIWRANQVLADACARDFADQVQRDEPGRLYVFLSAPAVRHHVPVFANDLNRHLYHTLTGRFGAFADFGYVGLLVYSEIPEFAQQTDWPARRFQQRLPSRGDAHFMLGRGVTAPRVCHWQTGIATVEEVSRPGRITQLSFQVDPQFTKYDLWVFEFQGQGFRRLQPPSDAPPDEH